MNIVGNSLLPEEQYMDTRWTVILWTEESGKLKTTPYKDSRGYATIGAGFKIDSNWNEILTALRFDTSEDAPQAEKDYLMGSGRVKYLILYRKVSIQSPKIGQ